MKRSKSIGERFLRGFFLFMFLLSGNVYSEVDLLVNFSSESSSNTNGITCCNTLIISSAINYSSLNLGGLFPISGFSKINGLNDGRLIIYIFDYECTLVPIAEKDLKISQNKLFQNYPNPFNPATTKKRVLALINKIVLTK